ncbi:saxitoxin and tetrodotoxin-binding protein 1-like [Cyprinodon tularosa]|uniref:saxitoxin and tetrodotoxin-binding protein 1-like n=1 Tax=Cyprinodon tularosa TaxID=77115 RepID=UPI0018E1DD80|nr:saxitoxin and tetrodotoxin-binding protein 1-like [Cyprinodon tularosa]
MSLAKLSLLLLLAVIDSTAASSAEECQTLAKKLDSKNLDKIYGEWVLVWSVSDDVGHDLLKNVTNSQLVLKLLNDSTIEYIEKNTLTNGCYTFNAIMTIPSDDAENSTMTHHSTRYEKDGVVQELNETAHSVFYESCSDCLLMTYKSPTYNFLLSYRKKGSHQDLEQHKAAHDDHKKLAECLGLPHDKPYIYDGVSDSCQNKAAPAANLEQA